MQYLSAAAVFVAATAILEGLYILLIKPKEVLNRRYFYMTLCIAVWLTGAAFAYVGETREDIAFWFRFCSAGFIFLHAFTLHFALAFSHPRFSHRWRKAIVLIYLPCFYFLYRSWTGLIVFRDFVKMNGYWTGVPDFGSWDFSLLLVNYLAYYLVSTVLLAVYRKRAPSRKEKRKAAIVILSVLGTILLYNVEPFLLPLFTNYNPLAVSPLFSIFWLTGIGYAVVRYSFLSWKPSAYSKEILDKIDEAILVFSSGLRVTYINSAVKNLFDKSGEKALPEDFSGCFTLTAGLSAALNDLLEGRKREFSCALAFKQLPHIRMDSKLTVLRDEPGDIVGLVYLGKEKKDPGRFSVEHSLTEKEQAVLRLLIKGDTLRHIASATNVSLRTVKAHAAHIYRKLGVRNKMDLFKMLQSSGLLPDASSDDSLFPLLEKEKKS